MSDKINLYLQKKELRGSTPIRLVLRLWLWVITPIVFGWVTSEIESQSLRNFTDMIIIVAWLAALVYLYAYQMVTSLRYFLSYATIFSLLIFMVILQILQCYLLPIYNILTIENLGFLFFYFSVFLATLIWSFISCCANIEVSEVGNAILSAIIFIIKDFLIKIHEMNIFNNIRCIPTITTLGLSNIENTMMKLSLYVCNFIFIIATLICVLKKYWHKKYRHL